MNEKEQYYYIWSIEHNAWWLKNRHGYTYYLKEAGKFIQKEAKDICNQANVVKIEEIMIPCEFCIMDI